MKAILKPKVKASSVHKGDRVYVEYERVTEHPDDDEEYLFRSDDMGSMYLEADELVQPV